MPSSPHKRKLNEMIAEEKQANIDAAFIQNYIKSIVDERYAELFQTSTDETLIEKHNLPANYLTQENFNNYARKSVLFFSQNLYFTSRARFKTNLPEPPHNRLAFGILISHTDNSVSNSVYCESAVTIGPHLIMAPYDFIEKTQANANQIVYYPGLYNQEFYIDRQTITAIKKIDFTFDGGHSSCALCWTRFPIGLKTGYLGLKTLVDESKLKTLYCGEGQHSVFLHSLEDDSTKSNSIKYSDDGYVYFPMNEKDRYVFLNQIAQFKLENALPMHSWCQFIDKLNLSKTNFPYIDAKVMREIRQYPLQAVTQINFSGQKLEDSVMMTLISMKLRNLETLNLANTNLSDKALKILYYGVWPRLTKLNLSHNKITDTGLNNLLNNRWRLTELDLSHSLITETGVRLFEAHREGNQKINIQVSENPISEKSVIKDCQERSRLSLFSHLKEDTHAMKMDKPNPIHSPR